MRNPPAVPAPWLPHEILWLESAMRQTYADRIDAYQDIAEMSGRTEFQVCDKANEIRTARRVLMAKDAPARRVVVPNMARAA